MIRLMTVTGRPAYLAPARIIRIRPDDANPTASVVRTDDGRTITVRESGEVIVAAIEARP